MTDHSTDDLRQRFQALKRADAGRAPAFEAVMARARAQSIAEASTARWRPSPLLKRLVWAGGLAAAAAVVAVIVVPRARSSSEDAAFEDAVRTFSASPAMGAWRSPTDGLLDLPGSRLISTTPSVQTVR